MALKEHNGDFVYRSLVFVRYPLSSYMTAKKSGFLGAIPSFEDYCARYLKFIKVYHDLRYFRYEDFVGFPEQTLNAICPMMGLVYDTRMLRDFASVRLTGNSGRYGADSFIHPTLMRPFDPAVRQIALKSPSFALLCAQLKYPLDPMEYALRRARQALDYDPTNEEAEAALSKWQRLAEPSAAPSAGGKEDSPS
jgi:hypothetical protein